MKDYERWKTEAGKYLLPRPQGSAWQKCVASHFPFHSHIHIHSFPLRLLTLLQLSQIDTKWCLSLTGNGKSFPWRLYLWGEQSRVSTKQDTIFPHSHAQPGNSRETEYLPLVQQLWVVQTGWRREETICLIITRRFMLLLRPALTAASFCPKAPLTNFSQSEWAKRPSLTLLTSTRLPLFCPCSYKWSGSSP